MKFIVTKELGKLARWLRILGFDTAYFTSDNMGTLVIRTLRDDRVIVTRRKEKIDDLQKQTLVISSCEVQEQLKEMIRAGSIVLSEERMFTRCALCNVTLDAATKEEVKGKVPGHVYSQHEEFFACSACGKVYWQGSHWGNVKQAACSLGASQDWQRRERRREEKA
jgi:uncharacterized protein with PIN domain